MNNSPKWIQITILLAGIYNILWGAWVVLFPLHIFEFSGMAPPNYVWIWQGVGMIIGVIGVAYILAAHNPLKFWPLIFIGWLGRVLGPIGFTLAAIKGDVNWQFGVTIITNDLIWLPAFSLILIVAWKKSNER